MNRRLCGAGALVAVLGIAGYSCAHREAHGSADVGCSPSGWVDRVEGDQVVLADDNGDERFVPLRCFAAHPREGTYVRMGNVDLHRTQEVRGNMDRLLEEMGVEELPPSGP